MKVGAITDYIDVAQIVLYVFWIFFFGLIVYLRREDKREGYPLDSDRANPRTPIQGFPRMPGPKTYRLPNGGEVTVPRAEPARDLAARPYEPWPGAPLEPTGNPMADGVGPAAYAQRANEPDLTIDGHPRIVPMRVASEFAIESRDPDPRGMDVVGGDGSKAGTVHDVWVDRAEPQIRYLEVAVGESGRRALVPIALARIDGLRRRVQVRSILGGQFATVPGLGNPDQVTRLEEDRISAYYAGGTLYAEPARLGPVL
ncbi:MAG TPA: photosynthetic reaction center subunit H [Steroidobacteraceae bacterium]|nr:photosynthetic reaction center subunit H [Steroidobacteraceae bacterium]